MIELAVFYVFAGLLLGSASLVITVRDPVHAALSLVVSFFSCAGIWLLLEAEFLAVTLVLVYVGAVMVLFLFVIMMLDINITRMRSGFTQRLPLALGIASVMLLVMIVTVVTGEFDLPSEVARHPASYSNVEELGGVLYTDYVYPFEIASVILLVAIIAAIALTSRGPQNTKTQDPAQQVLVRREDRVRLVKMEAEKR